MPAQCQKCVSTSPWKNKVTVTPLSLISDFTASANEIRTAFEPPTRPRTASESCRKSRPVQQLAVPLRNHVGQDPFCAMHFEDDVQLDQVQLRFQADATDEVAIETDACVKGCGGQRRAGSCDGGVQGLDAIDLRQVGNDDLDADAGGTYSVGGAFEYSLLVAVMIRS